MWSKIFALGAGGFIGSNLRYWISNWILERVGTSFPYGTLMVNVIGCFILGFITVYLNEMIEGSPIFRVFISSGLLGALTTFSTLSLETFNFIRETNYLLALLNIGLNIFIGLLAIAFGFFAAKAIIVTAYKMS